MEETAPLSSLELGVELPRAREGAILGETHDAIQSPVVRFEALEKELGELDTTHGAALDKGRECRNVGESELGEVFRPLDSRQRDLPRLDSTRAVLDTGEEGSEPKSHRRVPRDGEVTHRLELGDATAHSSAQLLELGIVEVEAEDARGRVEVALRGEFGRGCVLHQSDRQEKCDHADMLTESRIRCQARIRQPPSADRSSQAFEPERGCACS